MTTTRMGDTVRVTSALDAEAVEQAEDVEIPTTVEGTSERTRALRAEHVVAKAVELGRAKDFIRISQYLDGNAVDLDILRAVLERYGLKDKWRSFCRRTGVIDPIFR